MSKPKGKLKYVKTTYNLKSDIAIYYTLYFEDEDGKVFLLKGSSFLFDLEAIDD